MKNRKFYIALCCVIFVFSLVASFAFSYTTKNVKVYASTLNKRDLPNYLSEMPYTSVGGGKGFATNDCNAVNGGQIVLGTDVQTRIFQAGVSIIALGNDTPAYIEMTFPEECNYSVFETNYGVDFVQKTSGKNATVKILVDGEVVHEGKTKANDFWKRANVDFKDGYTLRLEVYAEEGVCVSFGDAAFYDNSPNALTKLILSERVTSWPAPVQRNYNLYGGDLSIGGEFIEYGFCVNSGGNFDLLVDGDYNYFGAYLGIDDGVAGGSASGSAQLKTTVYDKDGKILSSSTTPVLYGYNSKYKINLEVKDAYKINFMVTDGGDGIANDMFVIGYPEFSNSLQQGKIYLSDIKEVKTNVGYGTFGKDKTVNGTPFKYQIYASQINYSKGIGMHLVNVPYATYAQDKNNEANFAFATYDISDMDADFFEALVFDPASNGAYYEVYVDGKCEYSSGLIKGFTSSSNPYPVRVSVKIPDGAKIFQIRLIADTIYNDGAIDFVNAAFYKNGLNLFDNYIEEEVVSEDWEYPVTRGSIFSGNTAVLKTDLGERKYYDVLSSNSYSSYSFDVSNLPADTFTSVVGLADFCSTGKVKFNVEAIKKDGSLIKYSSEVITAQNSGKTITFYYGQDVQTLKLSVEAVDGALENTAVWVSPNVYKTTLKDVEYITDLTWSDFANGWGTVGVNQSVVGGELNVNGKVYKNGVSLHAFDGQGQDAFVEVNFPASYGYTVFECYIGVNKDTNNNGTAGTVVFIIEGDGKVLYKSNIMRSAEDAKHILVDITGVSTLRLIANNGDKSYQCDWADFLEAKISKNIKLLTPYLELESPLDDQSVVLSGGGDFTVTGTVLGMDSGVEVYLNGTLKDTVMPDDMGKFNSSITVTESGVNEITVKSGELSSTVTVKVAKILENAPSKTIKTNTAQATVKPAENGMIITQLKSYDGHDWLKGTNSFVSFINKVKIGGQKAEWTKLAWQFQDVEEFREATETFNINSAHEDFLGETLSYVFTFKDTTGKFTIKSVWSAEQDFDSPIRHKIDFINESGEKIYIEHEDTLVLELQREEGAQVTNNYTYKSAMYTTNYGYRSDTVNDGYHMNVFCTTDYNNGKQIDAGYVPWVSLNQKKDGLQNGVYFGVIWPDCKVEVFGKGQNVYVEAGFDDQFLTEIPHGETLNLPEVFFNAYNGDVDDGSNAMKSWYFAFMMPAVNRLDSYLPTFGWNFWEVLDLQRRSWRMSDAKFYDAVYEFSQIGVDEITIDTYWWKNISDWRGVHENWQSSMQYSSEFVHALGLYFTIYMQAGNGLSDHTDAMTSTGVHSNENWFARGDDLFWDEVCFADPDAFAYVKEYLKNYYMEFGLDGMRTDFGYILGYCIKEGHEHIDDRADVGYWTAKRAYELFEMMYELFPIPTDVDGKSEAHYYKWEDCNCGGTLKDFMSLSYGTRIQTTDAFSTSEVRRSFYDSSFALPSMQLMLWLNDYMYDPTGPVSDDQYRFWSVLMGSSCPMMSMLSDMPDITNRTLVRAIEIYDEWMRELVKYGNVYHNLPRYDGLNWDGMQYFDPYTGKGAAFCFKPDPDGSVDDTYVVPFKGLNDADSYYVWSENGKIPFATYTGAQLKNGIALTLEGSYKAEIIYFIRVGAEGAEEITAIPDSFFAELNQVDNSLEVVINDDTHDLYYLVKIFCGENLVYSYATESFAGRTLINGLANATYNVEITAYNKFGSSVATAEKVFDADSPFAQTGLYLEGEYSTEDIVINGQRYVEGYNIDLSDEVFGKSDTEEFKITGLDGSGKLSARFALKGEDKDAVVTAELYAVKGKEESLVSTYTLNKQEGVIDVNATFAVDTEYLKLKVYNSSPCVYLQTNTGYGRAGMYSGVLADAYEFSADVKVVRNGLNETFPRAGIFGAYVNEEKFSALYIDEYYSNIVVYERTSGMSSDKVVKIAMPKDFDYTVEHNLKAVRNKTSITYYVDGQQVASRTFVSDKSSVAIITEDAVARFANVKATVGGEDKVLNLNQKNTLVEIKGTTQYSTVFENGVWSRPTVGLAVVFKKNNG